MKKQLLLTLAACICCNFVFAQLKVESSGTVSIPNRIYMDGVAGIRGHGVLNVTSDRVDPRYDSILMDLPTLICTNTLGGMYAYVNYYNNKVTFRVAASGEVYSTAGFAQSSDSICKEHIRPLPSALNKIKSLRGVSFDYKESTSPSGANIQKAFKVASSDVRDTPEETASKEDIQTGTPSSTVSPEIFQQIEEEKSRKRIGLIAQEVEKVYPEVVRTQPDGTKGIFYCDLVAVLVEGIKELQDSLVTRDLQMKALEERLAKVENMLVLPAKAPGSITKDNVTGNKMGQSEAILYQNTPNPFNHKTEISYRLSSDARTAWVCIYNLNGQQLKKYPVSVSSIMGKITVSGSELTPGMYIYALVINNEVVDSKRMTLTD